MSHTPGPMEAARMQWWDGLSKQGDPMRIVNPLSSGFRAGWEAAGSINAELLEALKTLRSFMWKEGYADTVPAMAKADVVISKATGGAE